MVNGVPTGGVIQFVHQPSRQRDPLGPIAHHDRMRVTTGCHPCNVPDRTDNRSNLMQLLQGLSMAQKEDPCNIVIGNLVFMRRCIRHICRIIELINQPRGQRYLLIGSTHHECIQLVVTTKPLLKMGQHLDRTRNLLHLFHRRGVAGIQHAHHIVAPALRPTAAPPLAGRYSGTPENGPFAGRSIWRSSHSARATCPTVPSTATLLTISSMETCWTSAASRSTVAISSNSCLLSFWVSRNTRVVCPKATDAAKAIITMRLAPRVMPSPPSPSPPDWLPRR